MACGECHVGYWLVAWEAVGKKDNYWSAFLSAVLF